MAMTAEMALLPPQAHPSWFIGGTFVLAMIPIIIGATTSYLKMSVALGVLRNGFGAQQVPSAAVVMVISLSLSLVVMQPIFEKVFKNIEALPVPSLTQAPTRADFESFAATLTPWRDYLRNHCGTRELTLLNDLGRERKSSSTEQDPTTATLVLAFVLSELKEGMMAGFLLLLPFIVIDLVIANILAGLGMYMMSPTILSLPLKLLLFVSVDGWLLVSRGLIASSLVVP